MDPTSKAILQQLSHITALLEDNQNGHSDPELKQTSSDSVNEVPDYSQLFSCAPESTLKWPVFKGIVTDADSSLYSFLLETQKEDIESVYVEKVPDHVKDDFVEPCIRFLSSANRRNPIVDAEQLKRSARKVTEEGPGWDASSCLVVSALDDAIPCILKVPIPATCLRFVSSK